MNRMQDDRLLADEAYEALAGALRRGDLRDGQFLSISQLVGMLGFPVAAVRDAVKRAGFQGLLTALPKRGVQVMEARADTIRACLDFRMVLDQEGARRRIAANDLAGLGALKQEHEALRDHARAESALSQPPRAIEVDLSLHDFLAAGLFNAYLSATYEANRLRIAIIQNSRPFVPDRIASAMEEHLSIIKALEARDPDAAIAAIARHRDQTLRWWGAA